ncbi:hypothetical protein BC940DRAFT_364142 [Gongronella butleri]|nr:hypothetical protein BC940DRAFT_364142 [Gongronella butleri]
MSAVADLLSPQKIKGEPSSRSQDDTLFYIRSLLLKVAVMRVILTLYDEKYNDAAFVKNWAHYIENLRDDDVVAVRYVGMTERSAEHRAQQDTAAVDLLTVTHPRFHPGRFKLVDATEQFLIHLLGRDLLLNSQPGGFYQSFAADDDDLSAIRALRLVLDAAPTKTAMEHKQDKENVQNVLEKHVPGFANGKNDNVLKTFVKQAVGEYGVGDGAIRSPVMVIGDDNTFSDVKTGESFFGISRGGTLAAKLIGYVHGAAERAPQSSPKYPFADVYPTTDQSDLDAHILALAKVIQIARPVVIVPMGFLPTAIAYSNFHGMRALGNNNYSSVRGLPFICNVDAEFDLNLATSKEARDLHCIAIATVDPGFIKHGHCSPEAMRYMMLVWARVALIEDCALKVMQRPDAPPLMTRAMCEAVMDLWMCREAECDLGSRIDDAAKWHDAYAQQNRDARAKAEVRGLAPSFRADPDFEAHRTVANRKSIIAQAALVGQTVGKPYSPERDHQACVLLRSNYAILRRHPQFDNKSVWKAWFMAQKENKSIHHLSAAQARCDPLVLSDAEADFLANECAELVGERKGDREWLVDTEKVRLARHLHKKQQERYREKKKKAIELFVMQEIVVTSGRTYHRVLINGKEEMLRGGLWISGSKAFKSGTYILDLDPAIDASALVVKDIAEKKPVHDKEHKVLKVTEEFLHRHARDTYYVVFINTQRHLGLPVNERLLDTPQWKPDRIAHLIWKQYRKDGPCSFDTHFISGNF